MAYPWVIRFQTYAWSTFNLHSAGCWGHRNWGRTSNTGSWLVITSNAGTKKEWQLCTLQSGTGVAAAKSSHTVETCTLLWAELCLPRYVFRSQSPPLPTVLNKNVTFPGNRDFADVIKMSHTGFRWGLGDRAPCGKCGHAGRAQGKCGWMQKLKLVGPCLWPRDTKDLQQHRREDEWNTSALRGTLLASVPWISSLCNGSAWIPPAGPPHPDISFQQPQEIDPCAIWVSFLKSWEQVTEKSGHRHSGVRILGFLFCFLRQDLAMLPRLASSFC